jgi:aminoglycoside phosphotransferase (APT) family kinase protein
LGAPGEGYPWPWSVQRWLDGETAKHERVADLRAFAASLAQFLLALQRISAADGPAAGPHSFFRGGPLTVYDAETRRGLEGLRNALDITAAAAAWDAAVASRWHGPAVWVHGDIAVGNLLVKDGRLHAVIDFGSCAVGDPACDLVIAWTFLSGDSRALFRTAVAADDATWARARGWALWKALLTLADGAAQRSAREHARRVVAEVVAEHTQATTRA